MPMMATPVAIALVWTMMFHPQLGVLNYLLSFIHIGPLEWIYNQSTVIPSLVLVETWQWTPLVMLIVLGGLAAVPREPYESAEIDGANAWQKFRYLTMPMIAPFLMIAVIIRSIDAVKSFDIIYAMTQGGPGTASRKPSTSSLQYGVCLLRHRLRLGHGRRLLHHHRGAFLRASDGAPALAMERDGGSLMSAKILKRRNLDRLGLFFVALVMISPVILFFIWMISLSLKYEIDNGAYPQS